MVHVDDINGRRVISAKNSLTGAYSVGHVRLSARLIDRTKNHVCTSPLKQYGQ